MCVEGTPHAHPHADAKSAEPAHTEDVLEGGQLPVGGARRGGQIGRRTFLRSAALAGTGAALASALPLSVASASMGNLTRRSARFRDLTHVFRAGSPVYTFENPSRAPPSRVNRSRGNMHVPVQFGRELIQRTKRAIGPGG